jgi:hypothetical protein
MTELGPTTRWLIEAAREGLGPDRAAITRVHARVLTSVAAVGAIAVTDAAASATPTASAASAGTTVATTATTASSATSALVATGGAAVGKLVAFGAAIVLVATGATVATLIPSMRGTGSSSPTGTPAPVHRPVAAPAPAPIPAAGLADHTAPPAIATPSTSLTFPKHLPKARSATLPDADAPATAAPEIAPRPVMVEAPRPRATLAREVELVRAASDDVLAGHPALALAELATYSRETEGHGQLAEEAGATEVEALCTIHDPRARERFTWFATTWPASPEHDRLVALCRPSSEAKPP